MEQQCKMKEVWRAPPRCQGHKPQSEALVVTLEPVARRRLGEHVVLTDVQQIHAPHAFSTLLLPGRGGVTIMEMPVSGWAGWS